MAPIRGHRGRVISPGMAKGPATMSAFSHDFECTRQIRAAGVTITQIGEIHTRRSLRGHVFGRLDQAVSPDQGSRERQASNAHSLALSKGKNGSTFLVMERIRHQIVGKFRPIMLFLWECGIRLSHVRQRRQPR